MVLSPFLLAIPAADSLADHGIHDLGHSSSCLFFDVPELRDELLLDFGAVHGFISFLVEVTKKPESGFCSTSPARRRDASRVFKWEK
jgi:hypothetical protein